MRLSRFSNCRVSFIHLCKTFEVASHNDLSSGLFQYSQSCSSPGIPRYAIPRCGTFPEGSGGMNLNTIINIVIFKTSPCFDVSISLFQNFIISIIIEPINLILGYHILIRDPHTGDRSNHELALALEFDVRTV